MKKKIYIASPLGFSEAGRFYMYNVIIPMIKGAGFEVLDPWDSQYSEDFKSLKGWNISEVQRQEYVFYNHLIGKDNENLIKACDGVLAILDGIDVDSGTASEIGYASALGKPILGYRGDFRLSSDNIGSIVNLQVEYFIRNSGGDIITKDWEISKYLQKIINKNTL